MGIKGKVGFTKDLFDKDGKLILPGPVFKLLDEIPDVKHELFSEHLPEVTPRQIQGFDIVITLKPRWTHHSFSGNEQLICVHRTGVGYDMIDVPALTNAGVMMCITPDTVRRPVAVAIITFILALSTRIFNRDRLIRDGRWAERTKYIGDGLIGKTLGSIGVGNIGHEMFLLAKSFGMKHIAFDPYVKQEAVTDADVKLVDLNTLLTESDFVNISCPLNESTRHLIGEKELKKMKKTAFLINTARGPIVDEAALVRALQEDWIRGAGVDVFYQEPTPPDNPLFKMDNVIVTPHSMAWTDHFFMTMWEEITRHISQILHGEIPEGLVNREVLEKPAFQSKLEKFQV